MTFRTLETGGPVRLLQAGAGGMGRAWVRTLAARDDVELVGIVDLDPDAAAAAAVDYGDPELPVSADLTALLADVRPDALLDATIPAAHHPVTTEALFAGVPVLGEKPVAPTVAEALSLAAASELTGELFMVSQSRHYFRQLHELKARSDALGGLGLATVTLYREAHLGGFRERMDDPLLVDMAIHQFDVARYLTGSEPVSVSCASFNPRWSWFAGDAAANAVFDFADGSRFVFTGDFVSVGDETSWNGRWRLSCERGTLHWTGQDDPTGDGERIEVDLREEEIDASLTEFLHALRTGGTPYGEVHRNVPSLAMVEAAIASSRAGARVATGDVLEQALATAIADEARDDVRARLRAWPSAREALATTT